MPSGRASAEAGWHASIVMPLQPSSSRAPAWSKEITLDSMLDEVQAQSREHRRRLAAEKEQADALNEAEARKYRCVCAATRFPGRTRGCTRSGRPNIHVSVICTRSPLLNLTEVLFHRIYSFIPDCVAPHTAVCKAFQR